MIMKINGLRTIVASLAIMFSVTITAQKTVKVIVENVPSDSGKVLVATQSGQYAMVQAVAGECVVELKNVPEGKISFYVLHDSNDNKSPDMVDGLPTEYVGMMNADVREYGQEIRIKVDKPDKNQIMIK